MSQFVKPVVKLTNLEIMFRRAVASDTGHKMVMLRTMDYIFKLAPAHGRNKDAIYVTEQGTGTYLGKVQNGHFMVAPGELNEIRRVMESPQLSAIQYGRKTGHCSICGRPLVDPVSVHNAIGPICAEKLGILLEDPNALTKQGNLLDML